MENPESSQNCSRFKIPWGNGPCFITSTGAGDSKRGGGTHAKRHRKRCGIEGIHPQAVKGREKSRDTGNDHRPALEHTASDNLRLCSHLFPVGPSALCQHHPCGSQHAAGGAALRPEERDRHGVSICSESQRPTDAGER